MLAAILFDLDGTLADTDPIHFWTWQDILRAYGLDIDRAFYDTHFSGRLNEDIVRDLLPHLSPKENQQLGKDKEAEFRKRGTDLKPLAGLLDILQWTESQGLKRAIVTNAPTENAKFVLQALELDQAFEVVVLAEELSVGKPDPLPYTEALRLLQVAAEAAIAFEDSPSGVRSAVAAGIQTVGIATTHSPETLQQAGATLVVANFIDPQLQDWLRSRCSEPLPSGGAR